MKTSIIDSGFLYAFIDTSDSHHKSVSGIFSGLSEELVLPVPAITEVAYFILKFKGVEALATFVAELSESEFILETPTAEDYKRAADIIRKYNDANIDFVDAIIVAIAERLNITKILTIDQRHFRLFRPKHCAVFEVLP